MRLHPGDAIREMPSGRCHFKIWRFVLLFFLTFFTFLTPEAQPKFSSIHIEQQSFYEKFGAQSPAFYDSLNGFTGIIKNRQINDCQLQRLIFGFHPYWAGSDYLNYQWNLISDLCYFSYEVDPATGGPVSYHSWLTDPAIDSAKAHGVRVHLCATIFSGHAAFFTSLSARQNLIDQLISLVQQRNADGVNMDIELLPSSLGDSATVFMHDLSVQLKQAVPGALLSIDLPAVNWNTTFRVEDMNNDIDLFFIMGYDYYWNGSSQAGPVSPLYSLTSGYNYSLARTISDYESQGLSPDKFVLGVPYYGRRWETKDNSVPSPAMANGIALTYTNARNNSSIYNSSTYFWEPKSFSSCYIYFQNENWYQCFIGLDRDLRKKYDVVNDRNLAGIGIWALGYDDGYPDLWQAISDKFSDCYIPLLYDTIYDSGGPAWNYYTNEEYTMTIDQGYNDMRRLTFLNFSTEDGYDSLWVYAGPDTLSPLLGGFSGDSVPGTLSSPNGAFTLKFHSDGLQNYPGWMAVFHDGTLGVNSIIQEDKIFKIYPNPAVQQVNFSFPDQIHLQDIIIYDGEGRVVSYNYYNTVQDGGNPIVVNISALPAGWYLVQVRDKAGRVYYSSVCKAGQ